MAGYRRATAIAIGNGSKLKAGFIKVFSTFTGIGGFELGIFEAWMETEPETEYPIFVGYSEIDKYAIQVYEHHFKGVKNYGDITQINADELPDFDCLVGGFPCQAFSISGKRGGFNDTRGTLFFDLARTLKSKKPRLFVFENVKGLISHDRGRTFDTIIRTLDELGYDCQWQVLNSKDFGVPQNRERVIIVGHLRGTPRPKVFPISGSNSKNLVTLNQARHDYDRVYGGEGVAPALNTGQRGNAQPKIITSYPVYVDGKRTLKHTLSDESPTILASQYKSADNQPRIVSFNRRSGVGPELENAHPLESSNHRGLNRNQNQNAVVMPVMTPDRSKKKQNGRQIKPAGDPAHTLTATDRHGVLLSRTVRSGGRKSPHGSKQNWDSYEIDGVIRRLTPLECERLQAFPDNWTLKGTTPCTTLLCDRCALLDVGEEHTAEVIMSDTQRYKMCGNAVTTNVIQAVFERIFQSA